MDVPPSQTGVPAVPESETSSVAARTRPEGCGREVLRKVRERDPAALAQFFEAYFDRVFGLVYRLLGHRARAEDVTQEVFYKVQRAADRLDPERDPMPWLVTIAHNACRDLWRSSAHRLERGSASIDGAPELANRMAAGSNPEREVLAAERERLVQEAILELPETLRAPVVLHDYEGLSHEEVAEALGIRHDAARKRYSRALVALGKRLREVWG